MSTASAPSTGSPPVRRAQAAKTVSKEENVKVGKEDTSTANVSDILTRLLRYVSGCHDLDWDAFSILRHTH